jgi:hypothetical protein
MGRSRRNRARRIGLLLAAAVMLAVVGGAQWATQACSCAAPPDPAGARNEASAVFAGRVIGLELIPHFSEDPTVSFAIEDLLVRVAVSAVWKGNLETTTSVYTAFTCCVCGYPFEIGETYLIYADVTGDHLHTSVCTRTAKLADAAEDLAFLGPGTPPDTVPILDESPEP